MSTHPRSKEGKITDKEKVIQDVEAKYLEGSTTPSEYEREGDYSLHAVRTHFDSYPEAANSIGFPAPKDVPGVHEELEKLKDKWGEVNEEIYDAKGFFRSESIEQALGIKWEDINQLL